MADSKAPAQTYYSLLGLSPAASVRQIRQAYRDRSKIYHPDTTALPPEVAKAKFQQLNEAYATLSNPERRQLYDQKIGYSRIHVMQAPAYLNQPISRARSPVRSDKAYLDPSDRPLSAGEVFALFLLGVTFVACLALVIVLGIAQGETAFRFPSPPEVETAVVTPAPAAMDLPAAEPKIMPAPGRSAELAQPEFPTTLSVDSAAIVPPAVSSPKSSAAAQPPPAAAPPSSTAGETSSPS